MKYTKYILILLAVAFLFYFGYSKSYVSTSNIDLAKEIFNNYDALRKEQRDFNYIYTFIDNNINVLNNEQASIIVDDFLRTQEEKIEKLNERLLSKDYDILMRKTFPIYFDYSLIDTIPDKELKKLLKNICESGYKILNIDGTYIATIDYEKISKFGSRVNAELRDYIDIMKIESCHIIENYTDMTNLWDEIASRCVLTENYLSNYQKSTRHDRVENIYYAYLHIYLEGDEKNPIIDSYSNKVKPSVIKSYENTLNRYKNTKLKKIIERYLKLLKEQEYTFTKEIEFFIKKNTGGL
ncbi:hypothetical protein Q428_07295 [Fervidicella metallireducens AeB]|uniref:Uncharacterized protein n=1 Tax=Fervidicella metallireducens AeB TaxID=1403537 RepID=A0A017RXD9_9CLOT|nr:hypothetical protein [Fervidicella metallireducens]EYE88580.1 hypothetical protein Q428_07295 [Fervidicella metallireducens AeB]